MMNMMQDISKTLETKIIHTSSHSFEPSGVSLASVIESNEPIFEHQESLISVKAI